MSHFLAIVIYPEFFDFPIYDFTVMPKIGVQSIGFSMNLSKNLIAFSNQFVGVTLKLSYRAGT